MFKKFSSGILILIFIVLLAIYFIVRFAGSKERTFKDKVLNFDQSGVTQILIQNPGQKPVDLQLSGGNWVVVSDGRNYAADTNVVKGILKQLNDMPTKRYAGKGKDNWKKYEVTDSAATLVTLNASGKSVAEIYIGKFSYNMPKDQQQPQFRQQQGDMTTYVRVAGESDVYAVDGYLKMNFNREAGAYRNRVLANVNAMDITKVVLEANGSRMLLESSGGNWLLNGTPADSLKVARYSAGIARLSGSKFIDDGAFTGIPAYSASIEGNNFTPVQINAYPVADTNVNYVITSSANPGAYFNGKEGGLFRKIWKSQEEFLPAE